MSQARRVPIGDYGLIGDTRSAGLVAPDGSIDWLCLPRFDSPPVFGRLVGGDGAGFFSIHPEEPNTPAGRSYRGDTATLETSWNVDGGRLVVSDSMVAEVTGRLLPATLLVRRISSQGRPIRVRVSIAPRFGYEARPPRRIRRHGDSIVVERSDLAVALTTDAQDRLSADSPTVIEITPDRPVTMVLSTGHRGPAVLVPPAVGAEEAERDRRRWQEWADTLDIGPNHREAMIRSFITLRLLTYSPSGAPVAAPTTSLPEEIGGSRNWDYRYAWPRDASIGIAAFLAAGKRQEALGFLAWLLHASRLDRPQLPALFTLDGRPAPTERELEGWPGYGGSLPVRVGNGAGTQHQLDGYGWALDAAWQVVRRGHELDSETWRAMRTFASYVSRHWREPDSGIWERRDSLRHYVHSKLMAWLAMDRAIRIAERRADSSRHLTVWMAELDLLGADIRRRGYDPEVGSYMAAYGSSDLDASLLLLPEIGLEPADSPRVIGTIEAVRRQLGAGGPLLFRYKDRDGLGGDEGAFLPCSFWLVLALARTGKRQEAESLFEELVGLGGSLGLYAEEMDPVSREHLGNFPQALTHSAMLQASIELNRGPVSGAAADA
ncbi:MAG TPA: glycoside hydrolase family 15 protein [Acidimicrobiia bacterium]|nr:glycoside hydrolase family 15 protein [Acidimicrobiia bacterium]